MKEEIRVAKCCPNCGRRLFDKISLTTGYVEIKCPECSHIIRINLACRRPGPYPGRWEGAGFTLTV